MARKPVITIVGAGNLANALAPALVAAGYRIRHILSRDRASSRKKARTLARRVGARSAVLGAATGSDILWLCVSDDAIRPCAQALSREGSWKGKIVLHSSGALSSDELAPLRRLGASVGSLHPMMTFVPGVRVRMAEVPFAVEGDREAVRLARRIVLDLKARVFTISKRNKPLYHAFGSFSSPMVIATLAMGERVAAAAGVPAHMRRDVMLPIVKKTFSNYLEASAGKAFSGPLARGDVSTIRRHLKALKAVPGAREIYVALARSALRNLPARNRRAVAQVLKNG
ncbi:MAG TPA: Rossmann-like and DUF2520 domain-containing protein [Terriglobales bacterium]|nr:Rossmann-like and DUF2520 domain-containing protein [Terriglobales bacterium]